MLDLYGKISLFIIRVLTSTYWGNESKSDKQVLGHGSDAATSQWAELQDGGPQKSTVIA